MKNWGPLNHWDEEGEKDNDDDKDCKKNKQKTKIWHDLHQKVSIQLRIQLQQTEQSVMPVFVMNIFGCNSWLLIEKINADVKKIKKKIFY